jgi:uncharacterized protein (DUF983 family)
VSILLAYAPIKEKVMGAYNRCPDCGSLKKRYMPLGNKKLCVACYEEYAASAWIKEQKEKE